MAKLYNLARMTVTGTPGTGTITLNAATTNHISFSSAGVANGDVVSYGIEDGTASEAGYGTYTASGTTLTRNLRKSTTGSLLSLTSAAEVFITPNAEDYVNLDGAFGFRNRVINPSGQINQIGTSTAADGTYWFDQWVHLNQSNPVTPSQLTAVENGTPYMMRTTQSNASAQRFGILQPIEFANCVDMRGQLVTLSARVRMSATTTIRYAIVEWTGTADSPTKDVVNDWTSATFTTSNFFIGTTTTIVATGSTALTANTLATVTLSGTISSSANNLHVFFWTDSTQAQNVTFDVGKVQLEMAATATAFAFRSIQQEMALCQRYLYVIQGSAAGTGIIVMQAFNTSSAFGGISFPVQMRIAPTLAYSAVGDFNTVRADGSASDAASVFTIVAASVTNARLSVTTANLVAGNATIFQCGSSSSRAQFKAQM